MSKQLLLLLIALICLAASADIYTEETDQCSDVECKKSPADIVYHNGNIITMDPKNENPSFVAVTGGKIVAVERHKNKMGKYIGRKTQVVNLQKKTLIPGLVDSHSHFSMTASRLAQGFNLTPPPFGTVTSIPMLLDAVKAYVVANNIPAGQPIAGTGYIDIDMAEHRHPTRYELDTISTVHPIVLSHFSGHIVVANSLAMELIGYQNSSSGPAGGIIDAFPNGTVTGVCREYAILPLLGKFGLSFAKLTPAQIQDATNHYFSSGVTTAQDLLMSEVEPMVYHSLGDSFPLEVNGYFWVSGPNLTTFQKVLASYNTTRFKTRGVKFLLDGSIQGYTGLLTQPFWVPQSMYSGDLSNYTYNSSRSCSTESCGSDLFPAPTLLRSLFKTFINSNIDIHAHTVGDGASENMLNAVQWARNNTNTTNNPRVVMMHCLTARDDQLDRVKTLGMSVSFFPAHMYYWGEKHYNIFLGPTRASRLSPIGSAIRKNLNYTLHSDSPVVIAGVYNGVNTWLKTISIAVNRVTDAGRLLDDGTQKITAYQALKGMTINSAWQSHEDDTKGSIEVGKVADFAILSLNPLTTKPRDLDNLQVLTTIKTGNVVFGSYPKKRGFGILDELLKVFEQ